jgi:NAD+ synthase
MELTKDVLKIDAAKVADELAGFIRDQVKNFFKRKGAVIGLSGGIDSAVAGALCVKALGKERVHGLILPERDSNPVSREYGIASAKSLGITWEEINLTPMLETFGVYSRREAIVKKYFPELKEDYQFRLTLPQDLLDRDRINAYHLEVKAADGSVKTVRLSLDGYLGIIAANDIKQRTRMIQLYYAAEKRHYIVCGTTNLPEALQGYYVKYGDGGVDIEPLAPLYKDQVFQLGRHLGVPKEIINRTPSPDTYSYVVSDQEFYFCISYDLIDLILYAMEHSVSKEKTAKGLGITPAQLERAWRDIERKREATEPLRHLPPTPPFKF